MEALYYKKVLLKWFNLGNDIFRQNLMFFESYDNLNGCLVSVSK